MSTSDRSRVIRFVTAQTSLAGERSLVAFQRGTLDVTFARPVPPVEQTPHIQDELYVIVRGSGVLIHDGQRDAFASGDILFVAAGAEHQFDVVTDDLTLWRVFYGPHGGDIPG